jgi:2-amino-4-hydroxy-6-hydroxymethyldihydropteridine diphosphokinase
MIRSSDPIIPHPRLHERKFVLSSLVEIAPNFVHPVFGETQEALLAKLENKGS